MKFRTILTVLDQELRGQMLKDFKPDCCIGTTRAVCRILEHFGIPTQPFTVKVQIYNQAWADVVKRGDGPPDEEAGALAWRERHKAWAVYLGYPPDGSDSLISHLVAVVEHPTLPSRLMIDGSLGQASRPHRDLVLPDVFIGLVSNNFLKGKTPAPYTLPNGCVLVYRSDENNGSYALSPDWNLSHRTDRVTAELIRKIEMST